MWVYWLAVIIGSYIGMGGGLRTVALCTITRGPASLWVADSPFGLVFGQAAMLTFLDWRGVGTPPPSAALVVGAAASLVAVLSAVALRRLHPYVWAIAVQYLVWSAGSIVWASAIGAVLLLLLQGYEDQLREHAPPVSIWGQGERSLATEPVCAGILWLSTYSVAAVSLGTVADAVTARAAGAIAFRDLGLGATGAIMVLQFVTKLELPPLWLPGWGAVCTRLRQFTLGRQGCPSGVVSSPPTTGRGS